MVEIRKVRREDAECFVNAYFKSYQGLEEYAYRSRKLVKGYFKWLFSRDNQGFMVAELNGKAVGFVACDTNWISIFELKRVGEIHEIFVLPEFRCMGIASKLLSSALSYAKDKGRDLAELWVGEKNEKAIKFYENRGFRVVGKLGKWVRMVKKL
ncbi:MAG: hypothetical protein PWQ22_458 [Archaeoglobaceae archaeon]|nr:hypothetical protein [Archaeoglobaceae archaeon]